MNKILITGSAGFIGSALTLKLLEDGNEIVGIDNHNDYYDINLKEARLKRHIDNEHYVHYKIDISDKSNLFKVFKKHKPKYVVNLAAQAGVRYSLKNPDTYINSNILGFCNILEACRFNQVEHLIYASSSSVYGANTQKPFSTNQNIDHPLSLYAATKKSNELMAHTYSYLYNLPTTGLRFFTVYGPWDRPDMALQKFCHSIVRGEKIQIYNNGNHKRDFTYIDDIVDGVARVIKVPAKINLNWSGNNPDPSSSLAPWKIYNLGNNRSVKLVDFINILENELEKKAIKEFLPLQPGDVVETFADITQINKEFNFQPTTNIDEGIKKFIKWFKNYYK